jgi:polyhydroxyalkanoate synthesis regulator phasin
VEKFELNEEGLGIASAAAIASLFDALVLKGVLTGFEARRILQNAVSGIEGRQRTDCGKQATTFLSRLSERFPKK